MSVTLGRPIGTSGKCRVIEGGYAAGDADATNGRLKHPAAVQRLLMAVEK